MGIALDAPPHAGAACRRDRGHRLLLHVGLPKTATTTLQHNVLLPWHERRRINFLGRCAGDGRFHDPFQPLYHRIRRRRLGDGEIDALRPCAEALLDADRLNVLSNEQLAGVSTLGAAPNDAEAMLHNLHRLFGRCRVTVLASLRTPVDFVLAAYVEQYYWQFHAMRPYNTLDRFLRELLCQSPPPPGGAGDWLVCFPGAWLRVVRRYFEHVEVLLYEDLAYDRPCYFARLAACLGADAAEVERAFSAVRRHGGAYTRRGKRSAPLTVGQRVDAIATGNVRRAGHAVLSRIPPLRRLYRRVARIRTPPVEHRFPDAATRRRLQALLGLQDDYVTRAFGVSAEKLVRYRYRRPE